MGTRLGDLFWNWGDRLNRRNYAIGMLILFGSGAMWEKVVLKVTEPLQPKNDSVTSAIASLAMGILSGTSIHFWILLLAMLPFMWVGLHWTARRLKDLNWSVWLSAIILFPIANYIFVLLLSLVPSRKPKQFKEPDIEIAELVITSLLSAATGVALTFLSAQVLHNYGFGLFTVLPVGLSILTCVIYGGYRRRNFGECYRVSMITSMIGACFMLVLGVEGLICLLMAIPILAVVNLAGSTLGYFLQCALHKPVYGPVLSFATPLLLCCTAFVEPPVKAQLFVARTVVEVAGNPVQVWPRVIAYDHLPPSDHLLFRAGLAHPVRVDLHGQGVGATRVCQLSTGPMPEVVTAWQPGSLLQFDVLSNPPSMKELSPWPISPPHLHDTCTMVRGEIRLEGLPGNRTRLTGTTWYRNKMEPAWYWRLWSDAQVHAVHQRAFEAVSIR